MKRAIGKGAKFYIEGREVGSIETSIATPGPRKGEITVDLRFRPNWVSVWALMAASLDK